MIDPASSPTRDLEIHAPATWLYDPRDAHRLAVGLTAIITGTVDSTAGRFLADLAGALHHYAEELERAHDQVIADARRQLDRELDDGPLEDEGDGS